MGRTTRGLDAGADHCPAAGCVWSARPESEDHRGLPWDFGAGVASGYRRGRVFLVGDAAHRTTPRGATGIADGHNLGWKLARVSKGQAKDALLDSYEAEREPVGRANATASLQTMIDRPPQDGLAQDFGVEYTSAAIVGGTPLAGHRAPTLGWSFTILVPSAHRMAWATLRQARAASGGCPPSTSLTAASL